MYIFIPSHSRLFFSHNELATNLEENIYDTSIANKGRMKENGAEENEHFRIGRKRTKKWKKYTRMVCVYVCVFIAVDILH